MASAGTTAINDGAGTEIAVTFQGSAYDPVQVNIYVDGVLSAVGHGRRYGADEPPRNGLCPLGSLLGNSLAPYPWAASMKWPFTKRCPSGAGGHAAARQ